MATSSKDIARNVGESIKGLESIKTPTPDMKDDTLKAATAPKKAQTFGEAFKANRVAGNKTFTWGGKSYTTKTAGEGAKRSAPTRSGTSSAPSKPAASTASKPAATTSKVSESARKFMSNLPLKPAAAKPEQKAAPKATNKPVRGVAAAAPTKKPESKAAPKAVAKPNWAKALGSKSPAPLRAAQEKPKGAPGSLLMKRKDDKKPEYTKGRGPMKLAKGGSVNGIAIRGKTRAPLKKGK